VDDARPPSPPLFLFLFVATGGSGVNLLGNGATLKYPAGVLLTGGDILYLIVGQRGMDGQSPRAGGG
jgi:hypothetical protein